ncbi:MAG: GyrI-like domain-containing protein [Bacteroidota bacterium]
MKQLITLILILMETQTLSAQGKNLDKTSQTVLEVVLYKIKTESVENFENIKTSVRKLISEYPGFVSWKSLSSVKEDRLVLDLVEWKSLDYATNAATKVENDVRFIPFMNTTEEIRFMDHFVSPEAVISEIDESYYVAHETPTILETPKMNILSIEGQSSPESELFLKSIQTLYEVFHHIKSQNTEEEDQFVLRPLEAFWWVESELPFEEVPREEWFWKLLLPIPDSVSEKNMVNAKSPLSDSFRIDQLKIETLPAGEAVQIMHVGSYEAEAPTIEKLMDFVKDNDLSIEGSHHEIYLDDPNVTLVDQLKTILRYSVE